MAGTQIEVGVVLGPVQLLELDQVLLLLLLLNNGLHKMGRRV